MHKEKKHFLFVTMLIALGLIVNGCSTGEEKLNPELDKTYEWKSMSNPEVNFEKGKLEKPASLAPHKPYIVSSTNFRDIEKIPEQYLKIWIAPYLDDFGNFHEESSVHTVIKEGQWKLPLPIFDEDKPAI